MKSYTLFVKFYSPLVYYHLPTLDALIAYCLAKEASQTRGFYQLPCRIPKNNQGVDLLNKIIEHKGGGDGVPISSYLQPLEKPLEFMDSWKKRFDSKHSYLADFGRARRRIDTASGQYRSYNMPLPAKIISSCFFSFIGEGEKVVELITNNIIGIGKKRSEGFGWIDRLELKENTQTWQDILQMRPVPLWLVENHNLSLEGEKKICGWKPPYWDKNNICECIVPYETN